ncbi:hypothetical protein HPB50_027884 [Hyalomma asiaticum]|nr:hypothetical protein HPB50_027884 [Hyalomma asiaticum]
MTGACDDGAGNHDIVLAREDGGVELEDRRGSDDPEGTRRNRCSLVLLGATVPSWDGVASHRWGALFLLTNLDNDCSIGLFLSEVHKTALVKTCTKISN